MKKALGRGLDALIPQEGEEISHVEIEKVFPNPAQPRKHFDEDALAQLASSITAQGVIQPVIVSRNGDGTFMLIAGERRWRASNLAGLKKIPCIIRDKNREDSLEISLIENIQRENLNPIETAAAFQRLIDEFDLKQEEVAVKVGKDRATVANYLRLLNLPAEIKDYIVAGKLTAGHARAILSLSDPGTQLDAAAHVIKSALNVRETEAFCKKLAEDKPPPKPQPQRDPYIASVEDELIKTLGTKVHINHDGNKGRIVLEYYSLDELNRLIDILRI
ncbi:ParB/RepB/Spo0J family partition protein [Candidatus Magnetominusculus xianensis]|uniref:Chromosome partitioning protein ParB n=1 Tax=Candidatus Magnetominusculus xianensis TaxID=1748249 RepID=A0ABR5SJM5_9BACT|nr:ParB/RepB/Spo0J family partition protein [Candidatus Magnetominusculus xianensis]KWT85578.1 chromosome partitioning protein ParB [Candidatus Magnetominusculus xianensis]MBF0404191.1 ParB/RepB/Spo0J family partition protein [Nitrospirota bacterium]